MAALAVAGCGGQQGGTGVASVAAGSSAKPSTGSSPSATTDPQERGRKFAQCMREHGIAMEDPDPDGGGGLKTLDGTVDKKALQTATEACRDYAPSKIRNPSPQDVDVLRRLSQCMREHGVNLPDPNPDGTFPSGTAGAVKRDDPKFRQALEACNKSLPGKGAAG